jgi:hypothetical protein
VPRYRLPPTASPLEPADTVRYAQRALADLRSTDYRGYDPYDALSAPIFRLPLLRSARLPRFGAQQVLRRLPFDLRGLLRIKPGLSPVTLALVAEAAARLANVVPADRRQYTEVARECVARVAGMVSPGYSGACWGYEFDWEARYASFPAGTPTVVATGFVTHALLAVDELVGDAQARELCVSAIDFVTRDLNVIDVGEDSFCWSYSPVDRQAVLNATVKGARLCAEVHQLTGRAELADLARRTLRFVAGLQREDGSWPYAIGDPRSWSDNFHTAYVLEGFREYSVRTGDDRFDSVENLGWMQYRRDFFTAAGVPKYWRDRPLPVDSTACAQSIITLTNFGDIETARMAAAWAVELLGREDGGFGYQVRRGYRVTTRFARWSCAWMLCALSKLAHATSQAPRPG